MDDPTSPRLPGETMFTTYGLPSELVGKSILPDELNYVHMGLLSETSQPSNYNMDYQDWLIQTIGHLHIQNFDQVDWENILQELKSLVVSQRQELQKSLRVLMTYLLKYRYQSENLSASWLSTIIEQFRQTETLLLTSPSLKNYYLQIFTDCYRKAVCDVSLESGLAINTFPTESPFSPQDLLNIDFVFSLVNDGKVKPPHISVVIPVYKAEKCLQLLYERLRISLEEITQDFEIILVEDCGEDRSWEIISELAVHDSRVKGIQFSRNFGQHYGITAGLDYCTGDWVVVMDCDLQDRPEEIPRLYQKSQEGYDVVLARRGDRKDPPLKKLTSQVFYKIFNYLTGLNYDGEVGNFRIMSRQVVRCFCSMREHLRFFGGLIDWIGFPSVSVDIDHDYRFSGRSTYTFSKLWKLAISSIVAYSDKPLRIFAKLGIFISFISFIYGTLILMKAMFMGSTVVGWSSLIVSLYFLGGITVTILGIIGIYLGRTYDEAKQRPLYIVRSSTQNIKKVI